MITRGMVTRSQGTRESRAFNDALVWMIRAKQHTNCSDVRTRHMWLSEDQQQRANTAIMCRGCQVFEACGTAARARGETFGVWAGVDMTRSWAGGKWKERT